MKLERRELTLALPLLTSPADVPLGIHISLKFLAVGGPHLLLLFIAGTLAPYGLCVVSYALVVPSQNAPHALLSGTINPPL